MNANAAPKSSENFVVSGSATAATSAPPAPALSAPVGPLSAVPEQPQDRAIEVIRESVSGVPGVYALGGQNQRLVAHALGRIPRARLGWAPGLRVEVGPDRIAVDCAVIAEPATALHALADDIRRAVSTAVRTRTGLEVVEVNVEFLDIHLPEDDLVVEEDLAPEAGGPVAPAEDQRSPADRSAD